MSDRHELRAYEYIIQPYEAVRAALLADPLAVLSRATTSVALRNEAIGAELHAKAGPLEIGTEVDIQVLDIETGDSGPPHGHPITRISIAWSAKRRPGLFPTMTAVLSIYPLTPTETQLDFSGTYDPPLGILGDAIDAVALSGVAKESVTGFVKDVASFLRKQLSPTDAP
jgi:hypothetical protein